MEHGWLDSARDVLLNTRRGTYIAVSVAGLVVALVLGVSFSVAALIGVGCGIIAQQIADERWLGQRGPKNDSGGQVSDHHD